MAQHREKFVFRAASFTRVGQRGLMAGQRPVRESSNCARSRSCALR
jgi:hypothetical protein